jgi:hypothetical protein
MNSALKQLPTGKWILVERTAAGQVKRDMFGRRLLLCHACGICRAEWESEEALHPTGAPCCDSPLSA